MAILSLEIGTTGCKVIAFNDELNSIIASAYKEYPLIYPKKDFIELNPNSVWSAVKECIKIVSENTKHDKIKVLSISCLGKTDISIDNPITQIFH